MHHLRFGVTNNDKILNCLKQLFTLNNFEYTEKTGNARKGNMKELINPII